MELFIKFTSTTLLLLVIFHPVHLQNMSETTNAPGPTIHHTWLRGKKGPPKILKPPVVESDGSSTDDQATDNSGVGSSMESSGAVASGSYILYTPDDEVNDTTENPTQRSIFPSETTLAPEYNNISATTQWPHNNTKVNDIDTQNNETLLEDVEENPQNSTSNVTEIQTTAAGTERSEGNNDSTTTLAPPEPGTTAREASEGTTTTGEPVITSARTSTSTTPETTTSAPVTPDRGNLSDKGAAPSGGTAERGFGSESEKRRRKSAWGAVLGTFVAVAVVGLAAYVILKKKHHKAFSHRKLEEDFPADPVLRLDNSEPLDLNFGRAAYYNPGLQGDNIQMSPFPKN